MVERTGPPLPLEGEGRDQPCGGEAAVHLLLPAAPASVPYARARLLTDLREWGVSEPERHLVLVAVGEAITNAVIHAACPEGGAPLVIRWALRQGLLCVSVQDRGEGFDPSLPPLGDAHSMHPSHRRDADSGRGLILMHALMDRVLVDSTTKGTRVLMEKRLSSARGPAEA